MKKIELREGIYATIDNEDFQRINHLTWRLISTKRDGKEFGYAYHNYRDNNGRKKRGYLHHIIIGQPNENQRIHFADGNTLNCCKDNISYISRSQKSHFNQGRRKRTSSKYIGVAKGYWASIRVNGKLKIIGIYKSEKEAIKAYNNKVKELYGEYGVLNSI